DRERGGRSAGRRRLGRGAEVLSSSQSRGFLRGTPLGERIPGTPQLPTFALRYGSPRRGEAPGVRLNIDVLQLPCANIAFTSLTLCHMACVISHILPHHPDITSHHNNHHNEKDCRKIYSEFYMQGKKLILSGFLDGLATEIKLLARARGFHKRLITDKRLAHQSLVDSCFTTQRTVQ
ncbi:hypothetical protein U0070_024783, partial [Myodes glareolus]